MEPQRVVTRAEQRSFFSGTRGSDDSRRERRLLREEEERRKDEVPIRLCYG